MTQIQSCPGTFCAEMPDGLDCVICCQIPELPSSKSSVYGVRTSCMQSSDGSRSEVCRVSPRSRCLNKERSSIRSMSGYGTIRAAIESSAPLPSPGGALQQDHPSYPYGSCPTGCEGRCRLHVNRWTGSLRFARGLLRSPTTMPSDSLELDDELNRFRETWRKEVTGAVRDDKRSITHEKRRTQADTRHEQSASGRQLDGSEPAETSRRSSRDHVGSEEDFQSAALSRPGRAHAALALYEDAVIKEAQGNLSEALSLYRRAIKKDETVESHYRNSIKGLLSDQARSSAEQKNLPSGSSQRLSQGDDDEFLRPLQTKHDWCPVQDLTDPTSLQLISLKLEDSVVLAEDENIKCYISILPDELIVEILAKLGKWRDIQSIERFASTCRKLRSVSTINELWRPICLSLFQDPSLEKQTRYAQLGQSVSRHANSWRRMLIERPRILFDGCYVATCHYIRPGSSENAFINVLHMVTYFRYLRLYPNGEAVSLLTTDEPFEVIRDVGVHLLKRAVPRKGLGHGRWRMHADKLSVTIHGRDTPRYDFHMEFRIAAPRRGRWIKLCWLEYYSTKSVVSREDSSGAEDYSNRIHFGLEHEGSFLFSKVKSFRPQLT